MLRFLELDTHSSRADILAVSVPDQAYHCQQLSVAVGAGEHQSQLTLQMCSEMVKYIEAHMLGAMQGVAAELAAQQLQLAAQVAAMSLTAWG